MSTASDHRAAEVRLQEAFDASETSFWSFEEDTGQAYFSDGYFAMLGYRPGDFSMTFRSWEALLHPDEAAETLAAFRRCLKSPQGVFHAEYRLRTAKGGWRWVLGKGRVVESQPPGSPRRLVGINIDVTQRKLTERALVESEARWTSLVDSAPTGISLIGPQGILLFVNHNHSGFPDDMVLGRSWKDFLPESLHPDIDRVLLQGFVHGESSVVRTHRVLEDGSLAHFENHIGPVRDKGVVTSLMVVSLDVTQQIRVDAQKKKASRRQQILLDLHRDASLSPPSLLNRALEAMVELTDSKIGYLASYSHRTKQFRLDSWFHKEFAGEAMPDPQLPLALGLTSSWTTAVERRQPLVENEFQRPIFRFLTIPVVEKDAVVAVLGVANKTSPYDDGDLTEVQLLVDNFWQLKARREIETSLDQLYQAVEHSPVAIVITNPQGVIEYANPRFHLMTGYSPDEILGANLGITRVGLDDDAAYNHMWQTVRAGRDWEGELVNRRKNGQLYTIWNSISPVLNSEGVITHFVSVKEDITERKASQELVSRLGKMETIGQLAAGVAHDFNNLLTSVLGFNEMLLRKMEPGNPLRMYAEKIGNSGRRAAGLVSSLLAVGRQQRLSKSVIDLSHFLQEEEPLLSSLVKSPHHLEMRLGSVPLKVEVDPGQLSQVVVNLVSNARDALVREGTITVSSGEQTDSQGHWAWFRVEDDGPGVPDALKEKIFDPFFTTKEFGKGTGLGLSIVQGIVQQHLGHIDLQSSPGQGAQFTVWLPLITQA